MSRYSDLIENIIEEETSETINSTSEQLRKWKILIAETFQTISFNTFYYNLKENGYFPLFILDDENKYCIAIILHLGLSNHGEEHGNVLLKSFSEPGNNSEFFNHCFESVASEKDLKYIQDNYYKIFVNFYFGYDSRIIDSKGNFIIDDTLASLILKSMLKEGLINKDLIKDITKDKFLDRLIILRIFSLFTDNNNFDRYLYILRHELGHVYDIMKANGKKRSYKKYANKMNQFIDSEQNNNLQWINDWDELEQISREIIYDLTNNDKFKDFCIKLIESNPREYIQFLSILYKYSNDNVREYILTIYSAVHEKLLRKFVMKIYDYIRSTDTYKRVEDELKKNPS